MRCHPLFLKGNDLAKAFKADIVVDVKSPKGRTQLFVPTQTQLKGDIYPSDLASGSGSPAFVQQIGHIPGHQIQIDTINKVGKIIAKIGLPEHSEKLEVLRRLSKTERYQHARFKDVEKDKTFHLDDMELRTWLFHIARGVERNRFALVSGKLPTADEVLLEGPVMLGDPGGISPKDPDRPFYMADERDIGRLNEVGGMRTESKPRTVSKT